MAVQRAYPRLISADILELQRVLNQMNDWIFQLQADLAGANLFSGTIVTAKLTGGGTEGSMTFLNGRLVSEVEAT